MPSGGKRKGAGRPPVRPGGTRRCRVKVSGNDLSRLRVKYGQNLEPTALCELAVKESAGRA